MEGNNEDFKTDRSDIVICNYLCEDFLRWCHPPESKIVNSILPLFTVRMNILVLLFSFSVNRLWRYFISSPVK